MTNEELFYLLQKFWPGTINGTHYLTGHRLDTEGQQLGEAFLQYWRLPDPEPTRGQLVTLFDQNRAEIKATVAGVHHRWERNERLLRADALVYRAEDAGDEARAAVARKYRQALRDVPQLPGFPYAFAWPVPPEDDEVENIAKRDAVLKEVETRSAKPMAIPSMADDLLPPETSRVIPVLIPDPPPLETPLGRVPFESLNYGDRPPEPAAPPPDAELKLEGDLDDQDDEPSDTPPEPEPQPPFVPPTPPEEGPPIEPQPDPVLPPFDPSPQPDFLTVQDPRNAAEIALETEPVTKLKLFLNANPDVASLIEENVPPPEPKQ